MRGCVGTTDRVVRVLIGVVALAVGLTQPSTVGITWAYVADAVGVIGIVTGVIGRCPLYALLSLRTCKSPG